MISVAHNKPWLGTKVNWSHPLARGLVGCWLMNEGSGGKVYDLSGNGGTGNISLATWQPRKYGSCLYFNAASACNVNVGSNPAYDLTSNFTYAALVCNVNWANYGPIIVKGNYRTVLCFNAGKLSICINNVIFTNGNTTLNVNQTYLATWTHDPSVDKLYLNDSLDITPLDKPEPTSVVGTDLIFGTNASGAYKAGGYIEAIWIYNRALSASEVQQLYEDPFCMFRREPIELWYKEPVVTGAGFMTLNTGYWGY